MPSRSPFQRHRQVGTSPPGNDEEVGPMIADCDGQSGKEGGSPWKKASR